MRKRLRVIRPTSFFSPPAHGTRRRRALSIRPNIMGGTPMGRFEKHARIWMVLCLSAASAALALSACDSADSTDDQEQQSVTARKAGRCAHHDACVVGKHWDQASCSCVADATPATCDHHDDCVVDKHWDQASCSCVDD